MKKILKEPLLHFVVLGGLIFAAYAWTNGFRPSEPNRIVVSLRQQENLARTFERTWQRPPTQAELNGLTVDFLRQEIAYRESQKMQLDKDDIVIRRRLRQKLEMLAEDVALMAPPDEAQLQEYLDSNRDKFRVPDTATLQQVFFSIENGAAEAGKRAAELLSRLHEGANSVDLESAGDQSLLPPDLQNVRDAELDSLFGKGFAEGVSGIDAGTWGGPVRSAYGLHLVYVQQRVVGYVPELQEVFNAVQREWMTVRRSEAIDGLYERLGENYKISIEAPPEVLPDGGASQ